MRQGPGAHARRSEDGVRFQAQESALVPNLRPNMTKRLSLCHVADPMQDGVMTKLTRSTSRRVSDAGNSNGRCHVKCYLGIGIICGARSNP
jgi:hypothetical protein